MKLRLRTVLAVFLVCILVVPVFAYSAWQPEESFTDNLGELVLELRSAYEQAAENRAGSPDFLQDLEDLVERFEALLPSRGLTSNSFYQPGASSDHAVGDVVFAMRYAPSASFKSDDPAISNNDQLPAFVQVNAPFWISETEVTYELWRDVYEWAIHEARGARQYRFQNPGRRGEAGREDLSDQQPATAMNWRDAMVWCNALTEYYNAANGTSLACAYTHQGQVVRDSTHANWTVCDAVLADESATGFRLPTNAQWQLAARYIDGTSWLPGDHVSGDTSGPSWSADGRRSEAFGDYAWYWSNSGRTTQVVGRRLPNALGVYDMSGNVLEWCFDWIDPQSVAFGRIYRGGYYGNVEGEMFVGSVNAGSPDYFNWMVGFRFVKGL